MVVDSSPPNDKSGGSSDVINFWFIIQAPDDGSVPQAINHTRLGGQPCHERPIKKGESEMEACVWRGLKVIENLKTSEANVGKHSGDAEFIKEVARGDTVIHCPNGIHITLYYITERGPQRHQLPPAL